MGYLLLVRKSDQFCGFPTALLGSIAIWLLLIWILLLKSPKILWLYQKHILVKNIHNAMCYMLLVRKSDQICGFPAAL